MALFARSVRLIVVMAVWAAAADAAIAQDGGPAAAPASSGALEEITVTAQRREQSLQDVPIAISAFSEAQLTSRNIVDTYDLVRNVPNLTGNANVGVGTSSSLYIRGLGNAESIATFDLPVGTYVDDVYISRQNHNNFSMFDVERIEVLRGPQGTLFGRNTTGGAINIVMKKPAETFKGFVEGGVGSFGMYSVRASVDLPAGPRFLTKLSAFTVQDDGYATQLSTGIKFNDRDAKGVRADLRFLPSDALTIDFVGEYSDDRNTNFLNVLGADGARVINNRLVAGALAPVFVGRKGTLAPGNEATTKAATLTAKWDLNEALALTFIGGYRDTQHDFLVDSGGEAGRLTTVRGFTPLANLGDHEQSSVEIKLNGTSLADRLTWVAGAYYLTEDNVTDFGSSNNVAGVVTVSGDRTMRNGLDTYAIYAQGDFEFADRWTATLGLRFTDEKKDFAIDRNPGAAGPAISTASIAAAGIPLKLGESVWTPRAALQYALSDDVMFFASTTRGFKSGGWPARAVANNAFIPFKPEFVWSQELGFRADLFDRALRLNVTAFYSVTEDIQIPARIDVNGLQISTTTNPADLRNHGVEVDATWAPTEHFSLNAGLGFQKARFVNISDRVLSQAAACRGSPTALFAGAPACNANFVDAFGNIAAPVRAPDYTISLSATYKAVLGPIVLSPTFGVNVSDEYAIGTAGSPQSINGTWTQHQTYVNAQLTAEFTNLPGLSIAVDCRNCAEKSYPVSALLPVLFLDRPGTWGARIRYKF